MAYIPRNTLRRAREQWYAVLMDGDVIYKIQWEKGKWPFTIIAEIENKVVGLTQNSEGGEHDVLKVEPEYRGMWIGEMLFSLKTHLDGKREHEWSPKYSSIWFLIQQGYYPIAIIDKIWWTLIPLKREDVKQLCLKIREAKDASFQGDDADNFYYFQLAPWKAYFLARSL